MPMVKLVRIMGILPVHFESNGKLNHSLIAAVELSRYTPWRLLQGEEV
jgi:hypothetical protein